MEPRQEPGKDDEDQSANRPTLPPHLSRSLPLLTTIDFPAEKAVE